VFAPCCALTHATGRLRLAVDAPVRINNDPVHTSVARQIVGYRKMLGAAIVPHGYRAVTPAKPNLETRVFDVTEKILQQSVAFTLEHPDDLLGEGSIDKEQASTGHRVLRRYRVISLISAPIAGVSGSILIGRRRSPTLLYDFEVGTIALEFFFFGIVGRLRLLITAVRKDHALPRLLGIDPHHGRDRHPDVERDTGKSRAEADAGVGELEVVCSRVTDVEDDLAVLDVFSRHGNAINGGIDDDVGRMTVIAHPFVHRTNQVGTF